MHSAEAMTQLLQIIKKLIFYKNKNFVSVIAEHYKSLINESQEKVWDNSVNSTPHANLNCWRLSPID